MSGGSANGELEHPPIAVLNIPLDVEDEVVENILKNLPKGASDTNEPPELVYPDDREPGELTGADEMEIDAQSGHRDVEGIAPKLEQVHLQESCKSSLSLATEEESLMVFNGLAEQGLLQVTYDMGEARRRGHDGEVEYWGNEIANALIAKDTQRILFKVLDDQRRTEAGKRSDEAIERNVPEKKLSSHEVFDHSSYRP